MSGSELGWAAERLTVSGRVQGVGFRPSVLRLAADLGLVGWVRNTTAGAELHIEGPLRQRDRLAAELPGLPPPIAVTELRREPATLMECRDFGLAESQLGSLGAAQVPPDRAVCAACRAEVADPSDRRFGHALTACTHCGPRFSLIARMPYDRANTTQADFAECGQCSAESRDIRDRRFHAQTLACHDCGPSLRLLDGRGAELAPPRSAVDAACELLRADGVLALQGVGGFQLLCRADRDEPIARLRRGKTRPTKPFAVLVADLAAARQLAEISEPERAVLSGPENPIVLLRRRSAAGLAANVAPGRADVGVMLPATPLHALLADGVATPLICTSGNLGDEPPALDDVAARAALAELADGFLTHDRRIARRVDDSLVRVIGGEPMVLRLGRGYAPLPLPAVEEFARRLRAPPTLAVGGLGKAALALWSGQQAVLGPHLGDQDSPSARAGLASAAADLCELFGARPTLLAHDAHAEADPAFPTALSQLPRRAVPHHFAHALSAMAEHDLLDGRAVLAVTWDGTGDGRDGSVWGGEILRARPSAFQRIASLRPFRLPGGAAAIRHPGRVALSLLSQLSEASPDAATLSRLGVAPSAVGPLWAMLTRGVRSPWCSSVGRLLDGLAALILGVTESHDEGESAILLEAAAEASGTADRRYELPRYVDALGVSRADWRPMVAGVQADRRAEVPASLAAAGVHRALVNWVADVLSTQPERDVVLSGGCWANRRLTEELCELGASVGKRIHRPRLVPPSDGGLAVGQLVAALAEDVSSVAQRATTTRNPTMSLRLSGRLP